MHKAKINILFILSIFLFVSALSAADPARFMVYVKLDKRTYFADETIDLTICVKNISDKTNTFTIHDFANFNAGKSTYTTFQPQVYDLQGRKAELIVPYRVINKKLSVFLKELTERKVSMAPNEEISHSVDLNELYRLKSGRSYRVKSYFFPDFKKNIMIVSSNHVTFSVNKEHSADIKSGVEEKISRKQPARVLTPKEVILLALHAEKNNLTFEKYLNPQRLIYSYPKFYRLYQLSDDQDKIRLERKFIAYLHRDRHDYILDFTILKQDLINKKKAFVEAIVDRYGIKRTNRYKYKYTLERKNMTDTIWQITDIEAYVMKGIRR